MPSNARQAFDDNLKDIHYLLDIPKKMNSEQKDYEKRSEVLYKSAIVLITSFWEAYCEDIAAEGLKHIVEHSTLASSLPDPLKKKLAVELKKAPHELEVWKIADDGWRKYLLDRMVEMTEKRNSRLNTPRASQIDILFNEAMGIETISDEWAELKRSAQQAREELDQFVTLRGAIAHRGRHSADVERQQVVDYGNLVSALAGRTGRAVNQHAKGITGKALFETGAKSSKHRFT